MACVGGGSNSIGLFYPFIKDTKVKMIGVEAGGMGLASGKHAARFAGGKAWRIAWHHDLSCSKINMVKST